MIRLRSLAVGLLVAVAVYSWQMASSHGQVIIDWDASTGIYEDEQNWDDGSIFSPHEVPDTISESARFDLSGTYDVLFSSNVTVSDLLVNDGDVSFRPLDVVGTDVTYTIDDDVLIDGGSLTLTENASGFDVDLAVNDEVSIGNGQLNILSGSQVSNSSDGSIGDQSGSVGTVTVAGTGSTWTNSSNLTVGNIGQGTLNVEAGGQVSNAETGAIGRFGNGLGVGTVTVTGTGSTWTNSSDLIVGVSGQGTLHVEAGGQVSNSSTGSIGDQGGSVGTVTVNGAGSTWTNSSELRVGNGGQGTLNIEAGGQVSNVGVGLVGFVGGSSSTATVTGTGSAWTNSSSLFVGFFGQGTLNIEAGGQVSNIGSGVIGQQDGSIGTVTVTGTGSAWTNSSDLVVGQFGQGTLNIEAGGQVSNIGSGVIGNFSGSVGIATVTGTGSTWTNSTNLLVGISGPGTLNINDSGLVTVGSNTSINAQSSVVMGGGRFEFGTIDLASYARISGTSGELAGDLPLSGFNTLAIFVPLPTSIDVSEVQIINNGVLYGTGVVGPALVNSSTGELRTLSGEWARFGGAGNTNAGEVNNFGGLVEFEQDFTNEATGFVGGRGQFIADGGWTNEGVIAFSGGFADVLGDVANSATGQISVGGQSVVTFFDDVTMDPTNLNIDVAGSSTAVFLGSYNGGNDGAGTIEVLGDLRPGNSPAEVTFGGDLTLGSGANTFIELAGTTLGEFDRLDVAGDLSLDGDLIVSLLGSFELDMAMEFIIAQVDGALTGMFANFADGDLVGTFGGTDLFIDYDGGDGNDVALFTAGLPGDFDVDDDVDGADFLAWQRGFGGEYNAGDLDDWQTNYGTAPSTIATSTSVPEPSTLALCCLLGLGGVVRRRR